MSSIKNLSLKRINRDLKEIIENSIEGIGIVSLDNDPMKYVVNIKLMDGIYKNYCLQLLLTFTDDYPIKPPKLLIYPDQIFDHNYHHHIFVDSKKDENGQNFKKFCFDLLENDFLPVKKENTGWNPSYTISSLLIQVQNFLSNPDLPENLLPNNSQIKELMKSMDNYKRLFFIKSQNIVKVHTWKNPYPEMFIKLENKEDKKTNNIINLEENRMNYIKENLSCFMLKINFFEDKNIILGSPIIKNRIGEIYPIPELLSYEGFMEEISKIKNFDNNNYFKSANNKLYNYWIPIYINDFHFTMNKATILNSFSIIKYGYLGKKEFDFKSEYIFEILPKMLFNMIMFISNNINISESYIICFFQYILLFKKLFHLFKRKYRKYINDFLDKFLIEIKNEYIVKTIFIALPHNFYNILYKNYNFKYKN